MTWQESKLLELFRQLNAEGQKAILKQAEMFFHDVDSRKWPLLTVIDGGGK